MNKVFKGAIAATLIAGSTIAATAPAQADRGSTAVVAGIAGLAIGAALASSHSRATYYDEPATYYEPSYAPSAQVYYGSGYGYAPTYAYGGSYGYRGDYGRWDRGRRHGDHDNGRHNGWGHDNGRHHGWDHDRD